MTTSSKRYHFKEYSMLANEKDIVSKHHFRHIIFFNLKTKIKVCSLEKREGINIAMHK